MHQITPPSNRLRIHVLLALMFVNAWRRFRRLSIPVEVLVAGTLLFAIVVVLEGAKILPFYSSFLALILSSMVFGYALRDPTEAFAGGFIIGYGGFVIGLPFSFVAQYAQNPDAGLDGWLWSPVAGFVAALFFGFIAAILGGIGAAVGALIRTKWHKPEPGTHL